MARRLESKHIPLASLNDHLPSGDIRAEIEGGACYVVRASVCVDRENITGMGFATVGSDWISHMCRGVTVRRTP